MDLGLPLVLDTLNSPDLVSHLLTLYITVTILPSSLSPTRPVSSSVLVASAHVHPCNAEGTLFPPAFSHVSSRLGPGFLSVISLGTIYPGTPSLQWSDWHPKEVKAFSRKRMYRHLNLGQVFNLMSSAFNSKFSFLAPALVAHHNESGGYYCEALNWRLWCRSCMINCLGCGRSSQAGTEDVRINWYLSSANRKPRVSFEKFFKSYLLASILSVLTSCVVVVLLHGYLNWEFGTVVWCDSWSRTLLMLNMFFNRMTPLDPKRIDCKSVEDLNPLSWGSKSTPIWMRLPFNDGQKINLTNTYFSYLESWTPQSLIRARVLVYSAFEFIFSTAQNS